MKGVNLENAELKFLFSWGKGKMEKIRLLKNLKQEIWSLGIGMIRAVKNEWIMYLHTENN